MPLFLVRELVAARKGHNIITAPDAKPWLFPGKRSGHPLGDDALGNRLQRIGLNPRQDRSTAVFALATELPAAMLVRMLGLNIKVAVAGSNPLRATGPPTLRTSADAQRVRMAAH